MTDSPWARFELLLALPAFGVPAAFVQAPALLTGMSAMVWLYALMLFGEIWPILAHLEEATPTMIFLTLGLVWVNLVAWSELYLNAGACCAPSGGGCESVEGALCPPGAASADDATLVGAAAAVGTRCE
jgi:hypothetical protein